MRLYLYRARVVKVYDADTIRADIDLGFDLWYFNQAFRLAYINAPEVRGIERPQGLIARDWLREMVMGKVVTIETIKDTKGKYGRYLAVIWYEQKNINDLLVKEGYAVYHEY